MAEKDFSIIPQSVQDLINEGRASMLKKGYCNLVPLVPDIDIISSFIDGDLGIAQTIIKNLIATQLEAASDLKNSDEIREIFLKLSKSSLGVDFNDLSPTPHDNDTGEKPAPGIPDFGDKINLPSQGVGMMGIEKTIFKSIFETQKPYMEAAKIVIELMCDLEDIAARSAATLVNIKNPLKNKNALCYKFNEENISEKLNELESLVNLPKRDPISGKKKIKTTTQSQSGGDYEWIILGEYYSTGEKLDGVNYQITYIDIPLEIQSPPDFTPPDVELDPEPESVILAVFDKNGNRIRYSDLSNPAFNKKNGTEWIIGSGRLYPGDFIIEPQNSDSPFSNSNAKKLLDNINERIDDGKEPIAPSLSILNKVKLSGIKTDGSIKFDGLDKLKVSGIGLGTALSPLSSVFKKIVSNIKDTIASSVNGDKQKVEDIFEFVSNSLSIGDALVYMALLSNDKETSDSGWWLKNNTVLPDVGDLKRESLGPILARTVDIGTPNQPKLVNIDPEGDYILGIIKVGIRLYDSKDDIKRINGRLKNRNQFGETQIYGNKNIPVGNITYTNSTIYKNVDNKSVRDTSTEGSRTIVSYIIEGINPDKVLPKTGGDPLTSKLNSNDSPYKKRHAIGAIKKFVKLLIKVATKVIPKLKEILNLFSDPFEFIFNIIGEKLGETIDFFRIGPSGDLLILETIKEINELIKNAPDLESELYKLISDRVNIPEEQLEELNLKIKKIKNQLANIVIKVNEILNSNPIAKQFLSFNKETFELKFLMDGVASLELFGYNFGADINLLNVLNGESPIKLILEKIKEFSLCSDIDPNNSSNNRESNKVNSPSIGRADGLAPSPVGEINFNETVIYSTGEFKPDIDYVYFYIDDTIYGLLQQADQLSILAEQTGDKKLARDAYLILQKAIQQDPKSNVVKDRLKKLSYKFDIKPHMIFKLLLSVVSLPIKIVVKIICSIIEFFENITLSDLPTDLPTFLEFGWLKEKVELLGIEFGPIIGPTAILNYLGVNFDPTKLIGWLKDLPGLINTIQELKIELKELINEKIEAASDQLDELDEQIKSLRTQLNEKLTSLYDLTEFISAPFIEDLLSFNIEELEVIAKKPLQMVYAILEFLTMVINTILKLIFSILGIGAIIKCPNDNYTDLIGDTLKETGGFTSGRPALVTDGDGSGYIYYVFYDDGEMITVDNDGLNSLIAENPNIRFKFQFR
jgi:hypothetical protein